VDSFTANFVSQIWLNLSRVLLRVIENPLDTGNKGYSGFSKGSTKGQKRIDATLMDNHQSKFQLHKKFNEYPEAELLLSNSSILLDELTS